MRCSLIFITSRRQIGELLLLFGLLLSSSAVQAQSEAYYQANPDSLRRVLTGQRTDSARIRTLQQLLAVGQDETGTLQQLLPLLLRQHRPQYPAYHHWWAGLPTAAYPFTSSAAVLDSLQAALHAFDQLGQPQPMLLRHISTQLAASPIEQRAYLLQQLAYYQKQPTRWWMSLGTCLLYLGFNAQQQGAYGQAIGYFLRASELYHQHQYTRSYFDALKSASTAYAAWGNYAKAQQYLQRVLPYYQHLPSAGGHKNRSLLDVDYSLARLYQRQHQSDAALALVDEDLRASTQFAGRDSAFLRTTLQVLKSSLLLDQHRTAEAGVLLTQAQHTAQAYQLTSYLPLNRLPLDITWARYYTQRGLAALAAAAWQQAYHRAQVTHDPHLQLDFAQQAAAFYQAQHHPAQAAAYALVALRLADSLAVQQRSALVAPYEVTQADRTQAAQLAQASQRQYQAVAQARRQRRILLYTVAGVVGLLLLAGVLYAAFRRSQRLAQLVTAQKQDLQGQRDQLNHSLNELRQTQAQLIQKEKMASLGELTAGIAHEIQNPLNFVTNFSDVSAELVTELDEALAANDKEEAVALATDLRQNLTKIHQHGQRAASIVRGMLEHSRTSAGERQSTNLNQLADEYLRLAYHGLRAKDQSFNAELQADLAPDLPLVEAVPGDLGRVLLNLFTNAFYAVQQRQRAAEAGYVPTVSVRTRQVGQQVQLQVQDNGTGMSPEVQAKIFQPFFTTKPTGEGTGLGLSLSYDIVTKGHGGTLVAESQPGQGSTFTITLPPT